MSQHKRPVAERTTVLAAALRLEEEAEKKDPPPVFSKTAREAKLGHPENISQNFENVWAQICAADDLTSDGFEVFD